MKILSVIFIGFLMAGAGCSQKTVQGKKNAGAPTSDKSVDIRVLCYNIHHANPPSRPDFIDLPAIASLINHQEPDLVALQEVDVYTTRSGKSLHQADELAKLTGMKAYFAKAIDYAGGEYGVAILSKYPMETVKNYPLPTAAGTGGELRTLATAILTLPNGKRILFANTHLDAQSNDTNRVLQANAIVDILKPEKLPVILAGDFNAVASTRTIRILDKQFTRTCIEACGPTIPVVNPVRTIDYITYSPKKRFTVFQHSVLTEDYASDHRPVIAVVRLL
jgi:endonuclease/exonuclease/phosphatase family metal-dependent hydrolase